MGQRDIPTDRHMDKSLGADKLDSMEQIHQNLVYARRSSANLLLYFGTQVELTEWSDFKTPRKFQISIHLRQMSDSNQAQDADFKDSVARVLADEQIDSQSGHSSLDLNVEPDQVLPIEQHQADQLFVDVLGKRLERQSRDIRLQKAKKLIQHFAFDSDDLTKITYNRGSLSQN